jgi:hypothetical protein
MKNHNNMCAQSVSAAIIAIVLTVVAFLVPAASTYKSADITQGGYAAGAGVELQTVHEAQ